MSRTRMMFAMLAVSMMVLMFASWASAAAARPTPEEMRARMEQRTKEALGVTDEQWKDLKPKVEKVQALVRQVRGGGMGFGRRPTDTPAADQTAVEKAGADLQKVLQNKDAKAEEVAAALKTLRDARAKAKTELEAAVKELLKDATPRFEAGAVSLGLVE